MSNNQLKQILADVKEIHKGIGGTSLHMDADNSPIFIKVHNIGYSQKIIYLLSIFLMYQ